MIFRKEKHILKMTSVGKGSKVDLSTLKKWGKDGVIGYKMVKDHDKILLQIHSNQVKDQT